MSRSFSFTKIGSMPPSEVRSRLKIRPGRKLILSRVVEQAQEVWRFGDRCRGHGRGKRCGRDSQLIGLQEGSPCSPDIGAGERCVQEGKNSTRSYHPDSADCKRTVRPEYDLPRDAAPRGMPGEFELLDTTRLDSASLASDEDESELHPTALSRSDGQRGTQLE